MKQQGKPLSAEDLVKKLVEESGNNFHYKVVNAFRDKGWNVTVSPYYFDGFLEKPREIDIVAARPYPVFDYDQLQGYVNVTLFIECKYIIPPTAFWFDSKDMQRAFAKITSETELPPLTKNSAILEHHYCNVEAAAKLATSNNQKEQDNELIFKALNQCLNAFAYFKSNPINDKTSSPSFKKINYPIVFVNSFNQCHKVNTQNNNKVEKIMENFQYEINYVNKNQAGLSSREYSLVDIVSLDLIDDFLKVIDKDIAAVIKFIDARNPPTKAIVPPVREF